MAETRFSTTKNREGQEYSGFNTPNSANYTAPTDSDELKALADSLADVNSKVMEDGRTYEESKIDEVNQLKKQDIEEAASESGQTVEEYLKDNPLHKYIHLVRGAKLQCRKGSHIRMLNLPKCHGIYSTGHPNVHELDCIAGDDHNIPSFGVCSSPSCKNPDVLLVKDTYDEDGNKNGTAGNVKGPQCTPEIVGMWMLTHAKTRIVDNGDKDPGDSEKKGGHPIVHTGSFLVCAHGGIIEPISSGQEYKDTVKDMINPPDDLEKWESHDKDMPGPHEHGGKGDPRGSEFDKPNLPLPGGGTGGVYGPHLPTPPDSNTEKASDVDIEAGAYGAVAAPSASENTFYDPVQEKEVELLQDKLPYPLRDPNDPTKERRDITEYGLRYLSNHCGYDLVVPHKGSPAYSEDGRRTRKGQPQKPYIPIVSVVDSIYVSGVTNYILGTDEYYADMIDSKETDKEKEKMAKYIDNSGRDGLGESENYAQGNYVTLKSVDKFNYVSVQRNADFSLKKHDGKIVATQGESKLTIRYLHMIMVPEEIKALKAGDPVPAGTLLGYVGNTGRSDYAHLHFDINTAGKDSGVVGNKTDTIDPAQFYDELSHKNYGRYC